MTFDDQLRRAFDTLNERLRDEIARGLREASDELATAASADRQAAEDAAAAARAESAAQAAEAVAAARAEGAAEGSAAARAEADRSITEAFAAVDARAAELHALGEETSRRLADGIRAIDEAKSLTDTLDRLLTCVAQESSRAAVLLAGDEAFRGWRTVGFEPAWDPAREVQVPAGDSGVIADAIRSGALASTDAGGALPGFARTSDPTTAIAVPIAIGGQIVAAVYADRPAEAGDAAGWSRRVEVLARHAARSLEALTAFQTARILTERSAVATRDRARAAGTPSNEEDEAARRYARLLVSEIKLYHEAAVAEGRRERDLGARLGGEIARARVLYEERVPPGVRNTTDYFHAELVRTLADGDADLLGEMNTPR